MHSTCCSESTFVRVSRWASFYTTCSQIHSPNWMEYGDHIPLQTFNMATWYGITNNLNTGGIFEVHLIKMNKVINHYGKKWKNEIKQGESSVPNFIPFDCPRGPDKARWQTQHGCSRSQATGLLHQTVELRDHLNSDRAQSPWLFPLGLGRPNKRMPINIPQPKKQMTSRPLWSQCAALALAYCSLARGKTTELQLLSLCLVVGSLQQPSDSGTIRPSDRLLHWLV